MKIRVAGFEPESFVDGNGIRFTIFFQGCMRHCRGCHNPQTHDLDGGILMTTYEINREMAKNSLASGITLTGGEPLLQLNAAIELAKAAQQFGYNVWCYTGFTYENLPQGADRLLDYVDVLVDGEYREEERDLELLFCGSRNQRVIDVKQSRAQGRVVCR